MAPTRLRELGGTLSFEGYDLIEANTNGVAVQQKPASSGGPGRSIQDAWSSSLKADRDIAEFGPEVRSRFLAVFLTAISIASPGMCRQAYEVVSVWNPRLWGNGKP